MNDKIRIEDLRSLGRACSPIVDRLNKLYEDGSFSLTPESADEMNEARIPVHWLLQWLPRDEQLFLVTSWVESAFEDCNRPWKGAVLELLKTQDVAKATSGKTLFHHIRTQDEAEGRRHASVAFAVCRFFAEYTENQEPQDAMSSLDEIFDAVLNAESKGDRELLPQLRLEKYEDIMAAGARSGFTWPGATS
jgi:hypothetical protein